MKQTLETIGEFTAAAFILGVPFWGSWAYYIVTGEYLDFGGGR